MVELRTNGAYLSEFHEGNYLVEILIENFLILPISDQKISLFYGHAFFVSLSQMGMRFSGATAHHVKTCNCITERNLRLLSPIHFITGSTF